MLRYVSSLKSNYKRFLENYVEILSILIGGRSIMDIYQKVTEASKAVGISASSLKRYYLLFEQFGYKFNRNNQGHVMFSEYEIDLFKQLIPLKNQSGMTVETAIKQIMENEGLTVGTDRTDQTDQTDLSVMTRQVQTVMSELSELKQIVQQQSEIIQHQHEQITKQIDQRDRDLTHAMKSILETQKQIATATHNKKKWWKLW